MVREVEFFARFKFSESKIGWALLYAWLLGMVCLGKWRGRVVLVLKDLEIKVEKWHLGRKKCHVFNCKLVWYSQHHVIGTMWGNHHDLFCLFFPLLSCILYTIYILSFSLFLFFTYPKWLHPFPLPACLGPQVYFQSLFSEVQIYIFS